VTYSNRPHISNCWWFPYWIFDESRSKFHTTTSV